MDTTARTAVPLAWARVLGFGTIQLEYGHGVAVNGAGRVLVAARFDAPEGRETEAGNAGQLVQLAANGAERWRVVLAHATHLRVPAVALDDQGAAYVAGPYEPSERGTLDGSDRVCVTQLERRRARHVERADRAHVGGAAAVHRDGAITLAAVVKPRAGEELDPTARDLYVARLDATGSTSQRERFEGAPHACARLVVASTGADAVALAGYFSGRFTISGQEVRSATAASESVLVARLGGARGSWARALHGPELQAGLSVHGDASGAVLLAGWCAGGAMDFEGERIEAGERAAFFVARYGK